MKLLLSFLFLSFSTSLISQETIMYEGKEYFIYPSWADDSPSINSWNQRGSLGHFDRRFLYEIQLEIIPNFTSLQDGEYIMFHYSKRKIQPACFFQLENNLVEGKAIWLNKKQDILASQHYKKGIKEGEETLFSDNGNLFEHCFYKNGILDQEYERYYWDSQQLQFNVNYDNGQSTELVMFEKNGQLKKKEFQKDSLFITERYKSGKLNQRVLAGLSGDFLSSTYFFDSRQKSDSLYFENSPNSYYYHHPIVIHYFLDSMLQIEEVTVGQEGSIKRSVFHPNGNKKVDLYMLVESDYGCGYDSRVHYGSAIEGIYFDTIFNPDGSVNQILNEKVTNSSRIYHFEESSNNKKWSLNQNLNFINGEISDSYVESFDKKGNFNWSIRDINFNFLDTTEKDTILLYEKRKGASFYKEFWVKNDSRIYFEGENRYSNGLKKEFVTGYYKNNQEYEYSIKNDNNLPTYQTNLHLIFNPEGKQILKDSAGRISLDGEYLDGYFKFNSKNEYYDLDDMKWLNHSKEFNLKQIVTPNNFGSLKDLSYESWLPVAGYFKDGYQDSIWKFKLRYGKNKTTVKYKNGKLNGTTEHKLSTFEANNIKYSNDEYYNYKEVAYSQLVKNCKETKTYKNDTLIQSITRYKNGLIYSFNNYENSSISTYKLTPTGDTIDVSNKIGDTLHTRYYNQSGLTRHNKVCKNYCLIQKFEDGIITEKRTYLNNEYVGVSTFRNLHLNTIRKDNYDKGIINPDPNPFRRSSFVNSTPIKSNSIPKTKFYKDDLLEYEGYCNYHSYQESSNFYLINTVYFDTEKPKFKFFVDTSETNTNWLKEYYYNGNLKAEASKFHPTSSINCDEEPELKFDYIPYNFWTRDGKQTVTDGTGYIFYKNEGTPVFEGQLQDSIKVGTWKYYDGNGNLNEFGKYVDGEKDGVWYSGDLKHIHFLEECLDANNPNYEKTKSRLENEVKINVIIYKDGQALQRSFFEN
jgi:antitoxin component YwqK of YwqJK toxin-antitoxin module